MKFNKEAALRKCLDLWIWLAQNPEKLKFQWPGWGDSMMENQCPCCEYVMLRGGEPYTNHGCESTAHAWCPLKSLWPNNCIASGSPFIRWEHTGSLGAKRINALKIADGCKVELKKMGKKVKELTSGTN